MNRQVTSRLTQSSFIKKYSSIICQSRVLISVFCCLLYVGSVLYGNSASLTEIEILVNGQKSVVVERGSVVTITWNAEIVGIREPAGTVNKYPRIFRQLGDTDWRGLLEGAEYLKGTYTFDTSILPLNQPQTFLLYCQGVNGDAGGSVSVTAVERDPIKLIAPEFASYSNGDVVLTAQGSKKMYFSIESDLFGNGSVNDIKFSDASNGIQSATFTNLSDGLYRWFSGYEDGTESSEESFFVVDTVPPQVTVESVWLNFGEAYTIDDIGSGVATSRGNPNGAAVIVFTPVDYSSGLGDILLYKNGQEVTFYNFFNYTNEWLPGEPLGLLDETAHDGDEYTFVVFDNAGNIAIESVIVSETSNTNNINQPNSLQLPSPTPTITPTPIEVMANQSDSVLSKYIEAIRSSVASTRQTENHQQSAQTESVSWSDSFPGSSDSPVVYRIEAEAPVTSITVTNENDNPFFNYIPTLGVCKIKYTQPQPFPVPKVTIFFSGNGYIVTHNDLLYPLQMSSPGSFSFVGNNNNVLALTLHEPGQPFNSHQYGMQVSYEWTSSEYNPTPTPRVPPPSVQIQISQGTGGIKQNSILASHRSAGYFHVTWEAQNAEFCEPFGDWNLPSEPIMDAKTGEFILSGSELSYFNIDRYANKNELIFGITCTGPGGVSSASASVIFTDSIVGTSISQVLPSPTPTVTLIPIPNVNRNDAEIRSNQSQISQTVEPISLISPENGSYNRGNVELVANGNSQLTFVVSGTQTIEIVSDNMSGTQNVHLNNLPEGEYEWWAQYHDGSKSSIRTFQVDTTPPQVEIFSKWILPGHTVGLSQVQSSLIGNPNGALNTDIFVNDTGSGIARPSGLAINGRGKSGTLPVFYRWTDFYGNPFGTFSRLDNYAKNGDVHTFYFKDLAGNEGSASVTVIETGNQ